MADWPAGELEAVSSCPICGATEQRTLHDDLVDDTFFCAPGRWRLVACLGCESAFLSPRPTAASIGLAYGRYYTHGDAEPPRDSRWKAWARRQLLAFSASYARFRVGEARALPVVMRGWIVSWLPLFREVIDARYRHLVRPRAGHDRLLDLGCGGGDFLERARSLGWIGEGVDADPAAVEAARRRGLTAAVGSTDAYEGVTDRFDVVTCNHVIEHVHDPQAMLAAIHRILKPGGRLWIETPNIASVGHRLFGRAWRGLEVPRHVAIFSHRALVMSLRQAGFEIVGETPFNIQHIRYMFAASEAIEGGGDPNDTTTRLVPDRRTAEGLLAELRDASRREFVRLLAVKPGVVRQPAGP